MFAPTLSNCSLEYDVTITVDRDGGDHPNAAEFAAAAEQAASARAASIVSAHTASQVIGTVTVLAADQPAAVAVALADTPARHAQEKIQSGGSLPPLVQAVLKCARFPAHPARVND